jgi:hypothetical protein
VRRKSPAPPSPALAERKLFCARPVGNQDRQRSCPGPDASRAPVRPVALRHCRSSRRLSHRWPRPRPRQCRRVAEDSGQFLYSTLEGFLMWMAILHQPTTTLYNPVQERMKMQPRQVRQDTMPARLLYESVQCRRLFVCSITRAASVRQRRLSIWVG